MQVPGGPHVLQRRSVCLASSVWSQLVGDPLKVSEAHDRLRWEMSCVVLLRQLTLTLQIQATSNEKFAVTFQALVLSADFLAVFIHRLGGVLVL